MITILVRRDVWPKYAQVKNHVERFGVNILEFTGVPKRFNGIPSVMQQIQTPQNKPISLKPEIQQWMFGLFRESAPSHFTDADLKRCWRNTFMGAKAFTNKTGWDNGYWDVILDENSGGDYFKLQPTICHGAVVKVLRPPFYKGGEMVAEIEVLDVLDPSIVERKYIENKHVIFAAINWHRYPEPHGRAESFPLLDGRDVPVPLLGYGTSKGYIGADWLRFLGDDECFPSPYWPR